MNSNKHGLPRNIPSSVKRQVRKNSKFGCIFCRCAIYEYEHIVPSFSDAREHDPDKICLLCGQCHNKVSKGLLSKESVLKKYVEVRESKLDLRPFDILDINVKHPEIVIGNCKFINPKKIIELDGRTILSLHHKEGHGGMPTLSGVFSDKNGADLISIIDNEWSGSTEHWDLTTEGREIVIRHSKGHVALKIELFPPYKLVVHTLDIDIGGCHLHCHNGVFRVGRRTKDEEVYVEIESLIAQHPSVGICIEKELSPLLLRRISIVGGKGLVIEGAGISLARDSFKMHIKKLTIEHATREFTRRRTIFEKRQHARKF